MKKAVKKQWGGARKGSGPKPKEEGELKKAITLYVTSNQIDKFGGAEAFKKHCYEMIK